MAQKKTVVCILLSPSSVSVSVSVYPLAPAVPLLLRLFLPILVLLPSRMTINSCSSSSFLYLFFRPSFPSIINLFPLCIHCRHDDAISFVATLVGVAVGDGVAVVVAADLVIGWLRGVDRMRKMTRGPVEASSLAIPLSHLLHSPLLLPYSSASASATLSLLNLDLIRPLITCRRTADKSNHSRGFDERTSLPPPTEQHDTSWGQEDFALLVFQFLCLIHPLSLALIRSRWDGVNLVINVPAQPATQPSAIGHSFLHTFIHSFKHYIDTFGGFDTVALHIFSSFPFPSPSSSYALKCNYSFTSGFKSVAAVLFPPVASCHIKEFHFITLIFAPPKTMRKLEMEETSICSLHFFLLLLVFFISFFCTRFFSSFSCFPVSCRSTLFTSSTFVVDSNSLVTKKRVTDKRMGNPTVVVLVKTTAFTAVATAIAVDARPALGGQMLEERGRRRGKEATGKKKMRLLLTQCRNRTCERADKQTGGDREINE
ncbi:unnamed protein product [Taenia asiatica]|uniref:Uncharacterized protein n=1 Tax=Taenia asiatica TaxID=60517 RepID=A0A3P6P8H9_TAEAS|nr:unnamed protein product [Taenia asiatica]